MVAPTGIEPVTQGFSVFYLLFFIDLSKSKYLTNSATIRCNMGISKLI